MRCHWAWLAKSDGRYTISNLPAGDYFVTSSDDLDQGEWFDPAVIQRLARGAARVGLGRFDRKTQDLIGPAGR